LAKLFFEGHSSGHTGSNDTGLEFLSCRGAEKKGGQTHTHTQTDFGYYYIDILFKTAIFTKKLKRKETYIFFNNFTRPLKSPITHNDPESTCEKSYLLETVPKQTEPKDISSYAFKELQKLSQSMPLKYKLFYDNLQPLVRKCDENKSNINSDKVVRRPKKILNSLQIYCSIFMLSLFISIYLHLCAIQTIFDLIY
jgi:hypothetical protein